MAIGESPKQLNSILMERELKAAGYLWDDWAYGFRRTRNVEHETIEQYLKGPPDVIGFEELEDHGCFEQDATVQQRHAAEAWLRGRIKHVKRQG